MGFALRNLHEAARRLLPPRGGQAARRWVGLDLGSRSIKLVELEQTAAGPRLLKHLIQELPVAQGDSPVDVAGWLQSALKEFDVRDVHLSVGGPEIAVRRVHMPLMSTRELPEAVKWQIKEQVPFPIQESVIDFQVIGDVWEKDIKKQDVLVAAAALPFVRERLAMVERAGVRVASLIPAPAALWQCVTASLPEVRQGSVAVIDIGASQTQVAIAKDGVIRFVRELGVGSASMTEALIGVVVSETGEITVDRAKAEALKRRYGVMAQHAEGTTEEGLPLFHLASLLRPVLEHLLTELGRVFDFYKVQVEESGVSRVLLCGAGATLKELQPFLTDGLGLTVEVFNPLVRIGQRSRPMEPEQLAEDGPRMAVAMGLAFDHGQGLNLIPGEVRRRRAAMVSERVWLTAASALAAVALASYLGLQGIAGMLLWKIQGQEKLWSALKPAYTHCLDVATTCKRLEEAVGQAQQFLGGQPVWDGVLKELGELTPPTVELREMTIGTPDGQPSSSGLRISLTGAVAPGPGSREGGLAEFVDALERSVFFLGVELVSSEMRAGQTGTTSFQIEGRLE